MDFIIAIMYAVTVGHQVHGTLNFADDNRPVVTMEKHIEYMQKLKVAGNLKRMPNKLLNYNVSIDTKIRYKKVVVDNTEKQFVIAEPAGFDENGNAMFETRLICKTASFTECESVTQSLYKVTRI